MKFIITIILLASFSITLTCYGKNKSWKTYPNSSIKYPDNPKLIDPGSEVPQNIDSSTWKIISTINGVKTGTINGAPVFNNTAGRLSFIGFIPAGSIVKLSDFNSYGRMHYYKIKASNNIIPDDRISKNKKKRKIPKYVWIAGSYLSPD